MNDIYLDFLKRYLWDITDLEKNILFVYDENGLLNEIEDIDIELCPHRVIMIKENVIFRSEYENIKHEKDKRYILVLKNKDIEKKLLDFIKRSEKGEVNKIDTKHLLDSVEDGQLKWSERINEFHIKDIQKKFNELIYYRKLLRKKNVEKNEVDKVLLSAFFDKDATKINDEVDCYLYYRDIRTYTNFKNLGYKTDVKELLYTVFSNTGFWISDVIKNDIFNKFEKLIWIASALNEVGKLDVENIGKVMGSDLDELSQFKENLSEIVKFTKLIEKKNKGLYIQSKDEAERTIHESNINIYESEEGYRAILREGQGTYLSVFESISTLLKGFNLEGVKKVFKYDIDDLIELNDLIEQSSVFRTKNIERLKELFHMIVGLLIDIEYLEKQIGDVNYKHSTWEALYKSHLCNLQYRLSKIKYLDNQGLIESSRYELIDTRVNRVLNEYRKRFAEFIEKNYELWQEQDYGLSRPILNSDIEGFLNLEYNKIFIIVFDGMRYDAWKNIVEPSFKNILNERNTKYEISYSLLPSITSISREAIYGNILKNSKDDTNYIVKSESVKNESLLKESLIQDKRINILVFNMFDRDGHRSTDHLYTFYDKQRKVFEKNISELLSMIPKNSNIVIASDHGLMRNDEYINMKDEEGINKVKSRYLTLDEGNNKFKKDGFIRIKNQLLSYENKGYFVGGGEKDYYSHGGASIEEIMVPLIIAETRLSKGNSEIDQEANFLNLREEVFKIDNDIKLNLSFKLNQREEVILNSLYNFKGKNISNRDIEKILKNRTGKSGLVDGEIKRLIRKLKKDKLDIIEVSSAGDLIIYKLNDKELRGEI